MTASRYPKPPGRERGGEETVEVRTYLPGGQPGPTLLAVAMTNGPAWELHCAALRAAYADLAVERGWVRR